MELLFSEILFLLAANHDGDDHQLLLDIKSGNHAAFKKFFDQHNQILYHFLLKKGLAKEAAEDLVQQAFVSIWEKRNQIDEEKSLKAYLFKIAYTRMLNLFRDTKKFDVNVSDFEAFEKSEGDENPLDQKELNKLIEISIAQLPEKRQEVFRLCFLENFTYKEAADHLEVSVKTIENHMGLALKDLRNALSKVAKDFL